MAAKAKRIKGCQILAEITKLSTNKLGAFEQLSHAKRLKLREKCGSRRKCYCFGSSLKYKKGVQFCSKYMKGCHFGKISIFKLRVSLPV